MSGLKQKSKTHLLRIVSVQEIDLFFSGKGFTRQFIFDKLIYPNFFFSERTYYRYLETNAKKELHERGVDWRKELDKLDPINYKDFKAYIEHKFKVIHQELKEKNNDHYKQLYWKYIK